jgi:hypothetical protein
MFFVYFAFWDNLVKFVYKLGKNWQTRAWVPVFKTAGSAPDAAMILGSVHPALLHNFGCCYIILMMHKKKSR